MLLCIPCKLLADYSLDDLNDDIEDRKYPKVSLILIFDYDKGVDLNYNLELTVVKTKKKFNELANLVSSLLLFCDVNSKGYIFDEDLEIIELLNDHGCKYLKSVFNNKNSFNLFELSRLFDNIELIDASNLETLSLKKQIKSTCSIFNFITQLPVSLDLKKPGFLDKYLSSSLSGKYDNSTYFSTVNEKIDLFLNDKKIADNSASVLEIISNFYKVNRSNISKNIDRSLDEGQVIPELVWLSVHFYYMAKLSYTSKNYPVSFANALRCLEYYLDFLFFFFGQYYTKDFYGFQKLFIYIKGDDSDKEASGLGSKFKQLKSNEQLNLKDSLIKPIEKLIKLRNDSFFGHGILIPDDYYSKMAIDLIGDLIIDIEIQGKYKGVNWGNFRKNLMETFDAPIKILDINHFISTIPYVEVN